jgi:LysR family transcriptional regulator, nitrogen assimilation regulatory protein
MDFGQLKTILQVAETGSLLRASERLRVAQPALSRQVRLLEQELGLPLFVRHGRGMIPTPFGQKVIERARMILGEAAAIRNDAEAYQTAPNEEVVLGLPPNVAEFLTIPVLRRFTAENPHVRVRLVSAYSGHLQEWLSRGEVDLALIYEQAGLPSILLRPLVMETLLLVAHAARGLSLEVPVPFRSLRNELLVLPSAKHRLRQIVSEAAEAANITLSVVHEADDLLTVRDVVAAGMATSVLSLPAVHAQVTRGILSAAPLVDPVLSRRLDLAYAGERPLSRAAEALCVVIDEEIDQLVAAGLWQGDRL